MGGNLRGIGSTDKNDDYNVLSSIFYVDYVFLRRLYYIQIQIFHHGVEWKQKDDLSGKHYEREPGRGVEEGRLASGGGDFGVGIRRLRGTR